MQRYTYMRLIDPNHYTGFFVREFDSNLFLLICKTLEEQVFDNPAFNNAAEQEFIVTLLTAMFASPQFAFMLDMLDEADLQRMNAILNDKLDKVTGDNL